MYYLSADQLLHKSLAKLVTGGVLDVSVAFEISESLGKNVKRDEPSYRSINHEQPAQEPEVCRYPFLIRRFSSQEYANVLLHKRKHSLSETEARPVARQQHGREQNIPGSSARVGLLDSTNWDIVEVNTAYPVLSAVVEGNERGAQPEPQPRLNTSHIPHTTTPASPPTRHASGSSTGPTELRKLKLATRPRPTSTGMIICPYWVTAPILKWKESPCPSDGDHGRYLHRRVPGLPAEALECAFYRRGGCKNSRCGLEHQPTLHGQVAELPRPRGEGAGREEH